MTENNPQERMLKAELAQGVAEMRAAIAEIKLRKACSVIYNHISLRGQFCCSLIDTLLTILEDEAGK